MYHNFGVEEEWGTLRKIGEAGPMNWQEGVMCQFIGWKRFSNSNWEIQYQGYRPQVERRLEELRLSLDLPNRINRFLTHMLFTLLVSVFIFIAATFMPDRWQVLRMVSFWQIALWSVVYCTWALLLLRMMRKSIRGGFRSIEAVIPELKLEFSVFCDCLCGCINQNYITIFLKQ